METIRNFNDFCRELKRCGFSLGGGNDKGIFALTDHTWDSPENETSPIRWHTGDPETDPWQWRMRVLEERSDIAYAKVFFRTSGYITKEWYPYFIAARRRGKYLERAYADGEISREAKIIYETVSENGRVPLHEIKRLGGFGKEDKSRFDRALTELQMKTYLTVCGRTTRLSASGAEYGWEVTVFCTPEKIFGEELIGNAMNIPAEEAYEKIRAQVLKLNPKAEEKRIKKFIFG